MTVFDRRPNSRTRGDMEVALDADTEAVSEAIIRCLAEAGRQTQ
jgi:hypothetical protein